MSNKKTILYILSITAFLCCASYTPVEKIYEDSKIVKIITRDKKGITGWYIINYDTTNRITSINKYTPDKNTPVTKIFLQYRGKLVSSYTISSTSPTSDTVLYQSTHIFNYTTANELKRVDISFNKPASIKQAGTTFIRIQYIYTDKIVTGLNISGDALSFKISCTLSYRKNAIEAISIDEKRYNSTSKKFEQGLKGTLYVDEAPLYFIDEITGAKIKDTNKLFAIYSATYIRDAIAKLSLQQGNEQIINYFLLSDSSL
ncbi:MAG: hypothetical protein N3F66_09435 [Spirochaetes bacterium]|nr:hypothetical protein [Spirochaetota bacterium]